MAQDPNGFYDSDDDYAAMLAEEGDAIWEDSTTDPYMFYDSTPPPMRHVLDEFIFAPGESGRSLSLPKGDSSHPAFIDLGLESDHKEKEEPQSLPSSDHEQSPRASTRVKIAEDMKEFIGDQNQFRSPDIAPLDESDIERTHSPPVPVRVSQRVLLPDESKHLDDGFGDGYMNGFGDGFGAFPGGFNDDFRPGADPILVSVDLSDIQVALLTQGVRPSQIDQSQAELAAMLIQNEIFLSDLEQFEDEPPPLTRPGALELQPVGYDDMMHRVSSAKLVLPDDLSDEKKE